MQSPEMALDENGPPSGPEKNRETARPAPWSIRLSPETETLLQH